MLFNGYAPENFFDEMMTAEGASRPHYQRVMDHLGKFGPGEWSQRQTATDLAFMRGGVTFTVYSDSQGTERIFPFDLVPRIIPTAEWDVIERGLIQRLTALRSE